MSLYDRFYFAKCHKNVSFSRYKGRIIKSFMSMLVPLLVFVLGCALTVISANTIVKYACSFSIKANWAPFKVGLIILAIGTSLPEFITSSLANIKGAHHLILSNVIGSNLFNLLFVIGFCGLFFTIKITKDSLAKYNFFSLIIATTFLFLVSLGGLINQIESVAMIFSTLWIFYIILKHHKKTEIRQKSKDSFLSIFSFLIIGFIGLYLGGEFVLDGAVKLADRLSIPEALVGIFLISVGTSIPELATCLSAYFKGENEMAFSNIIGSNIINTLGVTGFAGLFKPILIHKNFVLFHIPLLFLITAAALYLLMKKEALCRLKAASFLVVYFSYCAFSYYNFMI